MHYIYTSMDCPKCTMLKAEYVKNNIPFEERDADRIKAPQDDIDREALINSSLGNMELPIEVEWPPAGVLTNCDMEDPTRYGLS